MEFLKALEEAKKNGISQEQFMKIWDVEIKLKQQQEEARLLELKLSCGTVQAEEEDEYLLCLSYISNLLLQDSVLAMKNQMKSLLQKHVKEVQQQINELKLQLQHDNKANFEEITRQFKSQGAATAMVIRSELESVLGHYYGNRNFAQQAPYSWDSLHMGKGEASGSGYQMHDSQQWNPSLDYSHSRDLSANSDQYMNGECLFPSDNGAVLCVRGLDELVSSGKSTESPVYILDESRIKVQLSIWFKSKGHLNAQLLVWGDQPLRLARVFTITGFIENRNSGSYSPLLEGKSQPLKKLKPDPKKMVNISVCLQTSKGSFDNVTFEELEKRNFVIDDSLIIKWFVTSEEAQVE
ncbi:unnamed protein product [Candidula unifasciata]|uniref:Uncharacterized protein n=1 Tax=Candidula unifasciata TaxID=100452 RepID=A0A8S3Z336_9EUPU|nr:unnamed protein product [Candidula unifasciata]